MTGLQKCWSCGHPQPGEFDESLHPDDCPEHDPETCLVCGLLREEKIRQTSDNHDAIFFFMDPSPKLLELGLGFSGCIELLAKIQSDMA